MTRDFGGVIWTNHALERLKQRGVSQGDAWATWRNPDQSRYAKTRGAWIYYKTYGNQKIEVVAKQNEQKKWIILSVWSRDIYQKRGAHSKTKTQKGDNWFIKLLKKLLKVN